MIWAVSWCQRPWISFTLKMLIPPNKEEKGFSLTIRIDGGTNPAMGAVITANVHVRADAWKIHAARDMQVWHHSVPCSLVTITYDYTFQ